MSLARAEGPFQTGEAGDARATGSALVIAVASTPEERVRFAQLISGHASVVLVSTREQAIALLLGGAPPILGRDDPDVPAEEPTTAPDLAIDPDLRTMTWGGRSTGLSPLEYDVLRCLLERVGRTWPFEVLHRRVWGNDHLGDRSDVQSVVKRLRRKLRGLGCPFQVMAVRGVGLRLVDPRPAPAIAPLALPLEPI